MLSTLILILAIVLIATGIISMMVAFEIADSPAYDPSSVSGTWHRLCLIMGLVFIVSGLILLIPYENKQTDTAYDRYVREAAPDSGYNVYYNGQAVSGSALGIDGTNFGDFDIKYDEKNKIIKIMQKR